jgi:hypothetical protein
MRRVQQVVNDLVSLDDGEMRVTKLHVVSSVSHDQACFAHVYSPLSCMRRLASLVGARESGTWRKRRNAALEPHFRSRIVSLTSSGVPKEKTSPYRK